MVARHGARRNGAAVAVPSLLPDAPLVGLPGIGPRTAERLARGGLHTVRDLLFFFPRCCRDLQELASPGRAALGQLVRIRGTVRGTRLAWLPRRRSLVTVEFAAEDGTPFAARFFNQPWLRKAHAPGQRRSVEGRLLQHGRTFRVEQARILPAGAAGTGAVQLRYREIDGIGAVRLCAWLAAALERVDWSLLALPPLPAALGRHDLPVRELFLAMHRPATAEEHERARTHFALREAVALFAAVERARQQRRARTARPFAVGAPLRARILARLPFRPTGDQRQAIAALWRWLGGPAPMGALLQGDVGTGKTAVAVAAALAVLAHGSKVAFLAPTELLAEQHRDAVARWLQGSDVAVELLTAALRPPARERLAARLRAPGPMFVFGTHALLSEGTAFADLDLVIIDEQHRFGVEQRMRLVHKGRDPHVLVMTATPIPRTLALVLFGDLDLVTLRERPAGSRPVRALHVREPGWERVAASIARAVRRGGRVYVVCPAIGADGRPGGARRVHRALAARFRCGFVHGGTPPAARQAVLQEFRDGAVDVLVGTTVLEVGVDVPAATLMVVIGADRFGLATLHQLRGRVGRGGRRGLCILCGSPTERIAALCATTCGFELAETDLRLRGGGELLGTAQSGFAGFGALDPVADRELLLAARQAVRGAPCGS